MLLKLKLLLINTISRSYILELSLLAIRFNSELRVKLN